MLWLILLIVLLIPLVAVILDSELGRALAARVRGAGELEGGVARRVASLESELERLDRELLRLQEQSDFLHRLLEERATGSGTLPPGERKSEPNP